MQGLLDALLDQRAQHSLLAALRTGEAVQLHALYDLLEGVRWKLDGAAAAAGARCARAGSGAAAAAAAAASDPLLRQFAAAALEGSSGGGGAGIAKAALLVGSSTALSGAAVAQALGTVQHSLHALRAELAHHTNASVPAAVDATAAALQALRTLVTPTPAAAGVAAGTAPPGSDAAAAARSEGPLVVSLPGLRVKLSELTQANTDLSSTSVEALVVQFHAYQVRLWVGGCWGGSAGRQAGRCASPSKLGCLHGQSKRPVVHQLQRFPSS